MLREWDDLPEFLQTEEVRPYYDSLRKKKVSLFLKRVFDIAASLMLIIILSPVMLIIAILIAADSKGGVFFRQERVTQYGKHFKIHKFRTMVSNADKLGSQVTVANDSRVTKIGAHLRRCRADEFPQLFDILAGNMSFVGTRPEVPKYVEKYTPEMTATLLLPAGVTSEASIKFKDEDRLLENAQNIDETYINKVLPIKMKYNLDGLLEFGLISEIFTMLRTIAAVLIKEKTETIIDEKIGTMK